MDYRQDKLGGNELGIYFGILCGVALLQSTGQVTGLLICPLIGFVFGALLDRITRQISLHQGWLEED